MSDRDECFTPFDRMYSEVSRMTRSYLSKLNNPLEHYWLANVIWGFQIECDAWQNKTELGLYVSKMNNFNFKMLHLTAGAYLHIAYDLPRVMADVTNNCVNMPGVNSANFENRLADIFDDLEIVFPNAISLMARRTDIFGYTGVLLAAMPLSKNIIETWIGNLRKRAWSHARQLQRMSHADRSNRENALLDAVTAALDDTLKYKPWNVLKISPPSLPMPKYTPAYTSALFLPFLSIDLEPYLSIILNLLSFVAVGAFALQQRNYINSQRELQLREAELARDERLKSLDILDKKLSTEIRLDPSADEVSIYDSNMSELLEHFGVRVEKYTAVAFENPESFKYFRSNFVY